ncbi:MAG: hypothetical protein ACAI25_20575 [Planctomycetota bacterium]
MKRTSSILALTLAASMPLSGCATTYLGGEYRTKANELARKHDKTTLAEGSEWLFFWGLLDSGRFNVQKELRNQLREDECVTDLEVKDRLSVGGFFLWLITAGIISHHNLIAKGHPAVINRPPAEKTTGAAPTKERETIIVPAAPVPAGSAKTPDYDEGYRAGQRDRGMDTKDRAEPRGDRSTNYNDGYRDGLKDSGGR